MADHNLDRQPGIDRVVADIKLLKNQLSELRTLQLQGANALNFSFSNVDDISPPLTIANGACDGGTFTLSSTSHLIDLFGIPEISVYEGSIDAANEIGIGLPRDTGYKVVINPHNYQGNNGHDLSATISVTNNTGSSQTICLRCQWRFIINVPS